MDGRRDGASPTAAGTDDEIGNKKAELTEDKQKDNYSEEEFHAGRDAPQNQMEACKCTSCAELWVSHGSHGQVHGSS